MRMHKRRQVGFQSERDFQLQEKKHVHVHFSQQVDDSGKLKTGTNYTPAKSRNREISRRFSSCSFYAASHYRRIS